jgi:hypothetical protein
MIVLYLIRLLTNWKKKMEPEYTIKDDAIVSTETAETDAYQEPGSAAEPVQQNTESTGVPEDSDNSFVNDQPEEDAEEPKLDQQMADQASSSSNNVAGMFTTTAGAVGVVAAVAFLSLGASDAEIIKVKSFENTVFYHVNISNIDSIDPDSLQLVLESTNDEYVVDLDFGETYGFVPRVASDTEFTVSLQARGTLGVQTLGQVVTQTSSSPNAVLYFPQLQNSLEDDTLSYIMRAYYEDPLGLIASMVIETGFMNPYTQEMTWFDPIVYDSGVQTFALNDIPNRNSEIVTRVQATLNTEEPQTVMIDETRFFTPLYHEASAQLVGITNISANLVLTPDFTYLPGAEYTVTLLDIDREVSRLTYTEADGPIPIEFTDLYTNTRYGVDVRVSFTNPGRSDVVELVLLQEEFVTPDRINTVTASVVNPTTQLITVTAKGNIAAYTYLYYDIEGERTLIPLVKQAADSSIMTLSFTRLPDPYTVRFGLTNEAQDAEYVIGSEDIERSVTE